MSEPCRAAKAALAALLCAGLLSGCSAIDTSLSPRTYTVNTGWDSYRNNAIMLNLARASHSAPLHFVAMTSYSGTGDLDVGASTQFKFAPGDANPESTFGPFTATAKSGNNIGLLTLDTQEFHRAMLAQIENQELYWLLQQRLPRELVFNVVLDSVRVVLLSGASYEFRNDPFDDQYTDEATLEVVNPSPRCAELSPAGDPTDPGYVSGYSPPFGLLPTPFGSNIWVGSNRIHERDCRYHKFLFMLQLGLKFGFSVEPVEVENPDWAPDKKDQPRKITRWQPCYDAALAREAGAFETQTSSIACGRKGKPVGAPQPFRFHNNATGEISKVKSVEPFLRSPQGVFRYLGAVLRGASDRVVLATRDAIDPRTGDARLLTVVPSNVNCFAEATYLGAKYCVPAVGAQNTKAVFALLASLVALHIKRSDLPAPSTILLRP